MLSFRQSALHGLHLAPGPGAAPPVRPGAARRADGVTARFPDAGQRLLPVPLDVTDEAQAVAAVQAEALGGEVAPLGPAARQENGRSPPGLAVSAGCWLAACAVGSTGEIVTSWPGSCGPPRQ